MVKQRECYVLTRDPIAVERLKNEQCPACGLSKADWKRRTDWRCCSKACGEKFYSAITSLNWQSLREKVLERDNYHCVKCGAEPIELHLVDKWDEKKLLSEPEKFKNLRPMNKEDIDSLLRFYWNKEARRKELEVCIGAMVYEKLNNSLLTADHIIPIALGGDEWDINNIQTLCWECNKIKTRKDIKAIADLRFVEKKYVKGQKPLTTLPQEMILLSQ